MIKRFKRKDDRKFYRINERIGALELRVIDSEGKLVGVLKRADALQKARDKGLDLVEIAPKALPPVAKIVDFNKFLYQEEKKKREEKRKAKVSETKEVRLGPFMNSHDLQVMVRRAKGFLTDGDKVRLVVYFSGRQITHPEFGHEILAKVIQELSSISKIERDKHFEGRKLITLVTPERKNTNEKEKNKEISS